MQEPVPVAESKLCAGAHLQIAEVPKLGVVGIAYILARTAGLMGGARLGAALGGAEDKIKKYVGMGILSQAGVAIGLSLIIQKDFSALAERPEVAAAARASTSPNLKDLCAFTFDLPSSPALFDGSPSTRRCPLQPLPAS